MNKTEEIINRQKELRHLYLYEKKSTREIGKIFGTSRRPVEIAMEKLGIEKRHTRTKAEKPTKEFLYKSIFEDRQNINDLASDLACDTWTIKNWCKEYGIIVPKFSAWTQRNARRGYERPAKDVLENLYNNLNYSLYDISNYFSVSRQAITDALIFHGIEITYSGWGRKRIICKDGHIVKSGYEQRVDDWLYDNKIEHQYEPSLPFRGKADFSVRDTFIEIFGVTNSKKYDIRKQEKIRLYKLHNCKLVIINRWDFSNGRNKAWERKLNHLKSSLTESK